MSIGFGYMAQGALSGIETLRQRRLKDESLDREAIALKRQNEWENKQRAEDEARWGRTKAEFDVGLESKKLALAQQPIGYGQGNQLHGLNVRGINRAYDRGLVTDKRADVGWLDSRTDREWMLKRRGKNAEFTDYLRAFTKKENAHMVTRREFDEAYTDWTRANAKDDRYTLLNDKELDRAYLKWTRDQTVTDKGIDDSRDETKWTQEQEDYNRKVNKAQYALDTQIPAALQLEINQLKAKGQVAEGNELIRKYHRQLATRSTIKEAISTGTPPIQAYKDAEELLVGMGYPATEIRKTIKLLESEGFQDTMKAVMQGDLRKAEQVWNSTGDNRIQVGSLAWKDDAKTVLEWQEVGDDGALTARSIVVSDQKDLWNMKPFTPSEISQAGAASDAAKRAHDIMLEGIKQSGKVLGTMDDWVDDLNQTINAMADNGDIAGMGVNTGYVVDFNSLGESLIRAGQGQITAGDALAVLFDAYSPIWGTEVSDQDRRAAFDVAKKAGDALLAERGIGAEPQPTSTPLSEPQPASTPLSKTEKSTLFREVQGFTEKYPDATYDDLLQALAGSGLNESDLKAIGITREQYR